MAAPRRVLIVENDQIVQLHLRTMLQDLGYEVTGVATTSREALDSAEEVAPNLVLMDVRLAGKPDGIDTARELRARHALDVVFLTAYADEETVGRAQDIGAAAYLVKPFSKPQLRATLSTVFARNANTRNARKSSAQAGRRLFGNGSRMAIYSHDTLGLGHLQRNLNLAWALSQRYPELSILLLTGSAVQHRYEFPPGVDTIKLPSVRKVAADQYEARTLDMGAADVRDLRSSLTLSAIQGFDPHILLVDHAPIGMGGEILAVLEWLHRQRPDCVRIAGLRDILDSPENVALSWSRQRIDRVLEDLYSHVVVYGAPEIYDASTSYGFSPALCAKTHFCGFVSRFRPDSREDALVDLSDLGRRRLVLVTIGGGDGSGSEVLGSYLQMLRLYRDRIDFESVLLTGPLLDAKLAQRFRGEVADLPARLVEFVPSTRRYLERSDLVICTGGYNTMVETATFASRALVIPRHLHRDEQLIRARTFAQHGLMSMLETSQVTPQRLHEEITRMLGDPRKPLVEARERGVLRLDGAQAFVDFCGTLEVNA